MSTKIFPIIQIIICLGAAGVYLIHKDWRHSIYWLCAATITATVTF